MKLHAFRIVKQRLASEAFTGEGARLYGGRWNRPGHAMVYTASSTSLAMLEMLVHLDASALLHSYVFFEVEFDDSLVTELDIQALPNDWRASPAMPEVQQLGDDWLRSMRSAVLRVPSAIIPHEPNYLLNPHHKQFAKLTMSKPLPIEFDPPPSLVGWLPRPRLQID